MKRAVSTLLALCLLVFPCLPAAAAEEALLTLSGKAITASATLPQLTRLFGQPKLTTPSQFGGSACTFYGENYRDFLFVETNAAGQLVSYGTVAKDFTAPGLRAGDVVQGGYEGIYATDYDDDRLFGYMGYVESRLPDWDGLRYEREPELNVNLCRHAAEMWNAASALHGANTPVTFDPRAVLVNQQLMDNGGDLYQHCRDNGLSTSFSLIQSSLYSGYRTRPNPLLFAQFAVHYTAPGGFYPVFVLSAQNRMLVGFLSPAFFETVAPVDYTPEEEALLEQARALYRQSVADWNGEEEYFLQHPGEDRLPLTPGVIAPGKLKGALGLLNAIRAGAGLPTLTLSDSLCRGCQMKAALTHYLAVNHIDNPSPHFPPQPTGMSDEDYALAQNGMGENLYYGDVLSSILNALNDSYGDPYYFGHRYNLLNPTWAEAGFGSTEVQNQLSFGIQGVHKTAGYQPSEAEFVGWPSKGVMLAEAGAGSRTIYSGLFYSGYQTTPQTTVTLRCLNTGECWRFTPQDETTDHHQFTITDATMVSYYDDSIALTPGRVYEITIGNVQNTTTGQTTDYVYRSVYERALPLGEENNPTGITLSQTARTAAVGGSFRLRAALTPADALNKMVTWQSDNEAVATVNECGVVSCLAPGQAVITATTAGGLTARAVITVANYRAGDVNDDGKVNATDALLVLRCAVGKATLTERQRLAGDANGDGALNAADALLILRAAVGKEKL